MSEKKPPQLVMDAFDFSHADLEANRAGTVTGEQHQKMRRWAARMRMFSVIAWIVFAAILGTFAAIIILGDQAGARNFERSPSTLGILIAVFALVMVVVTGFVVRGWLLSSDLIAGRFRSIEGPADLRTRRLTGSTLDEYTLRIKGLKFNMTRPMFDSLASGQSYRVYYAQNIILSIE